MNLVKSVRFHSRILINTLVLFIQENPSARIQFLLGDEDQDDDDEEHKPHDLFIELSELVTEKEKGNEFGEFIEQGWKETARFVPSSSSHNCTSFFLQ